MLWMLHYCLLYYLPEDIWIIVSVLYCIYVQTKPEVLLLNFRASGKQRQFGFILCHVCSQPMPTSTLFLSGSTWKLRKISIWLISWLQFLIHCGPLAICKDMLTLTGLFWGELSLCVSGSVFIFKNKFFVEMQAELLVTAEVFSLPPGKRCLQGKIKLEKKLPSANWWGTF